MLPLRRPLLVLVAFSVACTEAGGPAFGPPAELEIVAGNAQTDVVNALLPRAAIVRLVDADGRAVPNEVIAFVPIDGGSVGSPNVTTDVDGLARTPWTLGTLAGPQRLDARWTATGGTTAFAAQLVATAIPGAPASVSVIAGNAQSATVATAVPIAPSIVVRDAFANGVPGVSVAFAIVAGGGSITGATQTTNAAGAAVLGGWTLGTVAGANSISVTVGTLAPLTITATGRPGAPAVAAIVAGNAQSAPAGTVVGTAPAVLVRDTHGNAVPGVVVTFAVTAGGGAVAGGSATTDAAGIARPTSWTLGATAGSNSLSATVAGLAPLTFMATGIVGAAAVVTAALGNTQTAVAGSAVAVAPAVSVKDANGNPVPGIAVVFGVSLGGGSVTGATALTNAAGLATVGSWTLGTSIGPNSMTATAGTLAPVTFTATGIAGAPAGITIVAGNNQSATVNTTVAVAPTVSVRDANGNPASAIVVTFAPLAGSAISATAILTGAAATTDAAGVARLGSWQLYQTAGTYSLTATAGSVASATFTATATAGPPASLVVVQPAGSVTAFAAPTAPMSPAPAVELRDAFNNVAASAGVIVTAAATAQSTSGPTSPQTLAGASATTDATGRATFGALALDGSPGSYTVTFSSGTMPAATLPVQLRARFVSVMMGATHTCAMTDPAFVSPLSNNVYCWGASDFGQLGRATTITPRGIDGTVSLNSIPSGAAGQFGCLLTSANAALCWGRNHLGQLGDNTTTDRPAFSAGARAGSIAFTSVATGNVHTCGLTSVGAAHCWGSNQFGQLGDATLTQRNTPTAVVGAQVYHSISAGSSGHTCAINTADVAYCWGDNAVGQIGDGTLATRQVPTAVAGGFTFASISAGGAHTCGRTTSGAILCWGANSSGQLGDASTINRGVPTPIDPAAGAPFAGVVAGLNHSCARTAIGAVYCWGNNDFGQLGNGSTSSSSSPSLVAGGHAFAAVYAGYNRTCAITTAGIAYCWGRNDDGGLGEGTTTIRVLPTLVR